MKYMLLIYGTENQWTEQERQDCMVESTRVCDQLAAQGKLIDASPLESVAAAKTVRIRDGQALVIDGPFAETTEQLGGYYLLELADLDEAISVAAQLPPAKKGTVEIRSLGTLDGIPERQLMPSIPGRESLRPYMFLCYDDEAAWEASGPEALETAKAEAVALCQRLNEEGRYLIASPLHPAATATSVRVRNGRREITDGPYAETNEVLGGFYLILAESSTEAARIAAEHPGARLSAVEVRPLFELSEVRQLVAKSS
jgi:hypothetical protein